MPDEIPAFLRRTQVQRDREELDDLVEAAGACGAEERFQFGERELDRIEIGTVRRQKLQACAALFHGRPHLRLFVRREIIEDDDIARVERRGEDLFDIREERRVIDRPIKDRRRVKAPETQRHDNRVRLPVTAGRVIAEPRAARAAPIPAQQIGRDPALVEKQIVADVAQRLDAPPLAARGGHVRPTLFVGVYGFF